jgi:hypothetical protein
MGHVATRTRRRIEARERARRSRVRDLFVAGASIGVLAFLVAYALAAPTAELTASAGPTVPRPGSDAVVEGRVLAADGSGLEGARIEVRRAGRVAASAVSRDNGAFRVELEGGCSAYAVSLRTEADGSPLEADWRRRLCPGDALPIVARIVTQGHFLWVPGPR